MGHSSRRENVTLCSRRSKRASAISAMRVSPGTAVSAAAEVYGEPTGSRREGASGPSFPSPPGQRVAVRVALRVPLGSVLRSTAFRVRVQDLLDPCARSLELSALELRFLEVDLP